jgi:hypothetical protein
MIHDPALDETSLDRARAIALQSRDRAAWVAMGGSLAEWQRLRMAGSKAK